MRAFLIRLVSGKATVVLNAKITGGEFVFKGDDVIFGSSDFKDVTFFAKTQDQSDELQKAFAV